MNTIFLGHDLETGEAVDIAVDAYRTHVHMPGATGQGKSTAILQMLKQLLVEWRRPACHLVIDFLGGLIFDILLWMAVGRCPKSVRERLVLYRPSDKRVTSTMNPLLHEDEDEGIFKVNRGGELILRAWKAQDLGTQPRLANWLPNSLWACASLGLTIADSEHLVYPGSGFHRAFLDALPTRLRYEWHEILTAHGNEALRILESTRNRLKPFYTSGILRRLFGSVTNRFDALRFMKEGKIVLLDLSPRGRLSPPEANTIAGMVVNEFLAAARSLGREEKRHPTYLWLDEFQRICSQDMEYAIPEVRQLGIRLILAHQSFSQLETPEADLTSLIWQPQTRLAFAEQGPDADLLAKEFASIMYNPKWIKDELFSLRQLQTGHEKVELGGWTSGKTQSEQWHQMLGGGTGQSHGLVRNPHGEIVAKNEGAARHDTSSHGTGGGASVSETYSTRELLIAKLETIRELSSRTYYSFEEQRELWAQKMRRLRTGQCLLRLPGDPRIRFVQVENPKTGVLSLDPDQLRKKLPRAMDAYDQLIEQNYQQDCFVLPQEVDRETEERLRQILRPPIQLLSRPKDEESPPPESKHPFSG